VGAGGVEAAEERGVRGGQLRLELAEADQQFTAGIPVQVGDGRGVRLSLDVKCLSAQ